MKDKVDPKCHKGVYLIPCWCGKPYVGETGRSFNTRIQEHSTNIKHNRSKYLALAEHSDKIKHQICIKDTWILARSDHYFIRKFREAKEISEHPNNLNRDDGWTISKNWVPILSSKSTPNQNPPLINLEQT